MSAVPTCPNCARSLDHPGDGCVLHALIQVLRERENLTEAELLMLQRDCNCDALWDRLGPILDDLENGVFVSVP